LKTLSFAFSIPRSRDRIDFSGEEGGIPLKRKTNLKKNEWGNISREVKNETNHSRVVMNEGKAPKIVIVAAESL